MPKGKVIFFNIKSKFGFIKGEDEKEYYVHAGNVKGTALLADEEVEFEVREARRGLEAVQVRRTAS